MYSLGTGAVAQKACPMICPQFSNVSGVVPVSYTHLDVYKRQAVDSGEAAWKFALEDMLHSATRVFENVVMNHNKTRCGRHQSDVVRHASFPLTLARPVLLVPS